MDKEEFKWELTRVKQRNDIQNGDLRIVNLPVKVIFEWSDKIVSDYDSETDTVIEYTSGYVMTIMPDQQFVYKGEESVFLAQVNI
jgi:hypothetical protein